MAMCTRYNIFVSDFQQVDCFFRYSKTISVLNREFFFLLLWIVESWTFISHLSIHIFLYQLYYFVLFCYWGIHIFVCLINVNKLRIPLNTNEANNLRIPLSTSEANNLRIHLSTSEVNNLRIPLNASKAQ
jgi:hypothetical protein